MVIPKPSGISPPSGVDVDGSGDPPESEFKQVEVTDSQLVAEKTGVWPISVAWAGWWPSNPTLTGFPAFGNSPPLEKEKESVIALDSYVQCVQVPYIDNRVHWDSGWVNVNEPYPFVHSE